MHFANIWFLCMVIGVFVLLFIIGIISFIGVTLDYIKEERNKSNEDTQNNQSGG